MELTQILLIMKYIGITMMALIVTVYFISFVWNTCLLVKSKWSNESYIVVGMAVVSLGFCITYSYLIYRSLTVGAVDTSLFGAMVVRPLLLLQGSFLAALARTRIITAQKGGKSWILHKYKTLLDG